jgi:DNA repair photolyase
MNLMGTKSIKLTEAPRGAPFWRWYINFGVGRCEVGCLFCYNNRWKWSQDEWSPKNLDMTIENQFANFEWVQGKCKQYEGQHDIMMCSVGDPFAEQNAGVSLDVLDLARHYPQVGDHLRVLSKLDGYYQVDGYGDKRPSRKTMFGATIVTLDEGIKAKTMPESAAIDDVLGGYLYAAQRNYNPIFLSCEPMLKGMDLVALMELLNEHEHLDPTEIWVGRLNYGFGCEEFAMSDEEICRQTRLLTESYNVKVYLKREVKGSEELRRDGLVAQEGSVYD